MSMNQLGTDKTYVGPLWLLFLTRARHLKLRRNVNLVLLIEFRATYYYYIAFVLHYLIVCSMHSE